MRAAGIALILCFVSLVGQAQAPPAAPVPAAPPTAPKAVRPAAEFRMVPVRVHLIRTTAAPAAGTVLTAKDIDRIFTKVDTIWKQAGVYLWVESIVEDKPADTTGHEKDASLPTDALKPLRPAATLADGMFHVYYIHAMEPNGIYMGPSAIFVKETARLRKVEGGIDEPLPRVTAHELGHAMGLPHRQDTYNLLASGTTGTSVNDAEVDIVRKRLESFKWVASAEELLSRADALHAAGDDADAAVRYRAVADLPGESLLKARAAAALKQLPHAAGDAR